MAASPIVTSKRREEAVRGVRTEVVCTAFSNSILVVVTQYGKMGTLVYVDPDTIGDNVGRPSLSTKVLLGKDEFSFLNKSAFPEWGQLCFAWLTWLLILNRGTSEPFLRFILEPLVHVCAKNLVAFVSQEAGNKPVLLAMALKDKTMEGIQALREVIRSCQVW